MGWREPVDNLKTYPISRCSTDLAGQHDQLGPQDARSPSPVVADQLSIGLPRRAATYVHVAQQRRIGSRKRLSPYVVEPAEDSRPTHVVRRHKCRNRCQPRDEPIHRDTVPQSPRDHRSASTGATPQSYVGSMQLGQHAPASHVIAHVSDTHFGTGRAKVYSNTDPAAHLEAAMQRLATVRPDAIVLTGDIADRGEPEAYEAVASVVVDAAAEMGAELIGSWAITTPASRSHTGCSGATLIPMSPSTRSSTSTGCASSRSTPRSPAITTAS